MRDRNVTVGGLFGCWAEWRGMRHQQDIGNFGQNRAEANKVPFRMDENIHGRGQACLRTLFTLSCFMSLNPIMGPLTTGFSVHATEHCDHSFFLPISIECGSICPKSSAKCSINCTRIVVFWSGCYSQRFPPTFVQSYREDILLIPTIW